MVSAIITWVLFVVEGLVPAVETDTAVVAEFVEGDELVTHWAFIDGVKLHCLDNRR